MSSNPGKRRRLNYKKCRQCRQAKKKCEPCDRVWPDKCNRCIELALDCSANELATASQSSSPSPSNEADGDDSIKHIHDLSLRLAWVKRLNLYVQQTPNLAELDWTKAQPIFESIANEEKSVISDIRRFLEASYSKISSIALSSLTLLLATHNFALEDYEMNHLPEVSAELVERARNIGDFGTALTMQEARILRLLKDSNCPPDEINRYCNLYQDSEAHLKIICGPKFLPAPPLHNILLITNSSGLLPFISTHQHFIMEKDVWGRSLLHLALDLHIKPDTEVDYLFQMCKNQQDIFGRSPLHVACWEGFVFTAMDLLLDHGAEINLTDGEGRTPLHWAVRSEDEAIVQLLLENDANVSAIDGKDSTPLAWAISNENETITKLLLDNGADANLADAKGKTPLDRAVLGENGAIVKLLLDKGAHHGVLRFQGEHEASSYSKDP